MVILNFTSGRLGNRLCLFSQFIGNAIEFGYKLIYPDFDSYKQYFTCTSINDFGDYPISINSSYSIPSRLMVKMHQYNYDFHLYSIVQPRQFLDLKDKYFVDTIKRKRVTIARGWHFRDFRNVHKHGDIIRGFFKPVSNYQKHIDELIERCRAQCDILVGVHMRRDDLRTAFGGTLYFEDEIYYNNMLTINQHFRKVGKRVSFLLCSDEIINKDYFRKLNINLGTNHFIEDLYSLARCDCIIGVHSTFTDWAAFYGNVPKLHMEAQSPQIDLSRIEM